MTGALDSFAAAQAFMLTLPGTERTTSCGKPAVGVAANGRAFLFTGGEADTSFAVALDLDAIALPKEAEPETYGQSPHHEGWPAVLVRYASADPDRVREIIRDAHAKAAATKHASKRKA